MQDGEKLARARRRVGRIRGFYIHATIYGLVNALLIGINLATSHAYLWFIWPLAGWGIGVAAHGIAVFGLGGLWGAQWEERRVKQILEKSDAS